MTKIEIPSKKRPFKAIVAILTIIVLSSGMSYFNLAGEIINKFTWWKLLILIVIIIALIMFTRELLQFILLNNLKAVVEKTDDDTITFYCINSNGKVFNKSEHKLSSIKRIYLKKSKRMKGMITDKCIQYKLVKPNPFTTEDIKILPDLFEASDQDIEQMIHFVHSCRPEIEVGYDGIWK